MTLKITNLEFLFYLNLFVLCLCFFKTQFFSLFCILSFSLYFSLYFTSGFPYSFIHIYEWLLPLVHIGRWHDLTYRQTSFYCISLYCGSQMPCFCLYFFTELKISGNSASMAIYRCHFPNPICSCHVSVSHFGNSCSTCKFFIFIVCALLFCGSVIFSVTMATDFLFRIFKFCTLIFFFRHHAVSQLIDYSRV